MPEGPEVYLLSLALNMVGIDTVSHGKQLYFTENRTSWSFGLCGGVTLVDNVLVKKEPVTKKYGHLYGAVTQHKSFLKFITSVGPDFLFAPRSDIYKACKQFMTTKNKSGRLVYLALREQSIICGIGKFWADVILKRAGYIKTARTIDIDLDILVDSIISVRKDILEECKKILIDLEDIPSFINNFYNFTKIIRFRFA